MIFILCVHIANATKVTEYHSDDAMFFLCTFFLFLLQSIETNHISNYNKTERNIYNIKTVEINLYL